MWVLEALAYSSLWVSAAAGALLVAASLALGVEPRLASLGLAVSGTLVIYNVDHLRDLSRDRATAPRRSRFVEAHRDALVRLTLAAALLAAACAWAAGSHAALLLAPAAASGFFHRRLKRIPWGKAGYVAAAWVVVVVGLPALEPEARHIGWVGGTLGLALLANAVAANVRDAEGATALLGPRRSVGLARGLAAGGALCAFAAPAPVQSLAAVALATLAVLLPFQASERYGLIAVDGALIAGALIAAALSPG